MLLERVYVNGRVYNNGNNNSRRINYTQGEKLDSVNIARNQKPMD